MAQRKQVYWDNEQLRGFEAMVEDDEAESHSEAARVACSIGLHELGYVNGARTGGSQLSWVAREIGKLFAYFGVAYLGFTWFYPPEFRVWAVFFFVAALTCYGLAAIGRQGIFDGIGWPGGEKA